MGRDPLRLTKRQADLLQWVKDGCPDGVYADGYEHRIVARALERRGLVSISGRGATWRVTMKEVGPGSPKLPEVWVEADAAEADDLLRRVFAAGGRLVLPEDRAVERAHEQLVRDSLKSPNRPRGKKLELVSTGYWGQSPQAVIFTDYVDDFVVDRPVAVPDDLTRCHPAVTKYVANKDWQYVTPEHVPRAARLLQALAAEAANRECEALEVRDAVKLVSKYDARVLHRGHIALRTPAGVYGIQVKEIPLPGSKKLERRQHPYQRKTRPKWVEHRGWEFIGSGELELIMSGPDLPYNGKRFRDAKKTRLEEKLPTLFREFEVAKLRGDALREKREREEAEERIRFLAERAVAREQYFERARWDAFQQCSRDWHEANAHRVFLVAARAAAEAWDGEERESVLTQLDLAERHVESLDPLVDLARLVPRIADPGPEDLHAFRQSQD